MLWSGRGAISPTSVVLDSCVVELVLKIVVIRDE